MQVRLLEIGLIAPPVGMVCFVVAGMDKTITLQMCIEASFLSFTWN